MSNKFAVSVVVLSVAFAFATTSFAAKPTLTPNVDQEQFEIVSVAVCKFKSKEQALLSALLEHNRTLDYINASIELNLDGTIYNKTSNERVDDIIERTGIDAATVDYIANSYYQTCYNSFSS